MKFNKMSKMLSEIMDHLNIQGSKSDKNEGK